MKMSGIQEGNSGGPMKEKKKTQSWWTPEFSLVVVMLGSSRKIVTQKVIEG